MLLTQAVTILRLRQIFLYNYLCKNQLPSLLEPDMLVLVISPISALIREQVLKLQGLDSLIAIDKAHKVFE